jgi:acyl carrier protein
MNDYAPASTIDLLKLAAFELGGISLPALNEDDYLTALGIDSILGVEICANIEDRLNLRFSDDDLGRVATVGDLVRLVNKARGGGAP